MLRTSTPCSGSVSLPSRVTSPVDKEGIRRQIVGLAGKHDIVPVKQTKPALKDRTTNVTAKKIILARARQNPVLSTVRTPRPPSQTPHPIGSQPLHPDVQDTIRNGMDRSKSAVNLPSQIKHKPKLVRFRMEEHMIGKHKAPIVNISEVNSPVDKNGFMNGQSCEIRGSAIAVRKEGLKGLLELKEMSPENEKRQNSLHASLKIFRRRIKLNQEKFIQPNETTTEDYVIHSARSPFCEVNATTSGTTPAPEERPGLRPLSSDEHVRILRSALHTKHNGGMTPVAKQTDNFDSGESYKNIKCSYRLPENLNWSKGVSFKDIKDDSIPNVKTYVLEDAAHPHVKYKKVNAQNAVTLNTHNLNVHDSITRVNDKKVKVGDCEVAFDPRFVDWLEDSLSNSRVCKSGNFMTEETLECCSTPSVKRRVAAKT